MRDVFGVWAISLGKSKRWVFVRGWLYGLAADCNVAQRGGSAVAFAVTRRAVPTQDTCVLLRFQPTPIRPNFHPAFSSITSKLESRVPGDRTALRVDRISPPPPKKIKIKIGGVVNENVALKYYVAVYVARVGDDTPSVYTFLECG